MAAPTEVYVDLALDTDTGTGTIGDPYGRLQFALDSTTAGGTGHRFNCKGSFTQTAAFNLTTYGVPTLAAPVTIEGYTTAAGDGGIATFNGASTHVFYNSTTIDFIHFKNLALTAHTGTSIISWDNYGSVINCEFSGMTGVTRIISCDTAGQILNCYFHDLATATVILLNDKGCLVAFNRFMTGPTNDFTASAIDSNGGGAVGNWYHRNLMSVTGAADGIQTTYGGIATHNSIYSAGGTGQAIDCANGAIGVIANNLIEGFSGAGGEAISLSSGASVNYCDGNKFFDNTTNIDDATRILVGNTANTALTVTPFTDAANGDFTPVNTDSIFNTALPDKIGLV